MNNFMIYYVPSSAKYYLLLMVADLAKENFLRYLDLRYVNPLLQIKDLPSIISCEPIKSFKKFFYIAKSAIFGVKGILQLLVHN